MIYTETEHPLASGKVFNVTTCEQGCYVLDRAEKSGLVAIQLETSGPDPTSDIIKVVWIATAKTDPVALFEMGQLDSLTRGNLESLLQATDVKKIFYDSAKEISFLKKNGFDVGGKKFDISIAHKLLNAGILIPDFDLDTLVWTYITEEYSSSWPCDDLDSDFDCILSLLGKCGDLKVFFDLREAMIEELIVNELVETAELEFECVDAVCQLNLSGIAVDPDKLEAVRKKSEIELLKKEKEIRMFFRQDLNVNSPKILRTALNNHPDVISENIIFSDTQRTTFMYYLDQFPVLQSIIDYRHQKNIMNSVNQLLDCVNKTTKRVNATYDQMGSVTGRMPSRQPPMQNMPKIKQIRECFVAKKGNKLVFGDYSQAEVRIAAEFSGDLRMIDAFRNDVDFHALTASLISGKSINDVQPYERSAAKALIFGTIFGMGIGGLMTYAKEKYGLDMSIDDAVDFQDNFFSEYPALYSWKKNQVRIYPPVTRTLGGRIRILDADADPAKLLNSPIQGTAADMIKRALWIFSGRVSSKDALIVGCIHDEIIVEVSADMAGHVSEELTAAMIDAGQWYLYDVPVAVDVTIGDHWS